MPKILLHICCGPCSTVPIPFLKDKFEVFSLFYNPNIYPKKEKELRLLNAKKAAKNFNVDFFIEDDDYDCYHKAVKGKEENIDCERCKACYRLRLAKAAFKARELRINFFSTTLLISPYQDHEALKKIAQDVSREKGVKFFYKDFRPYFRESQDKAKEMGLYRQKYCGCEYSINGK
ncbi:MAG: epoxyqueuosine reductase QueH [Patescibacteria group bacterium]|nr:epoxyqueuosine reductase QueH [Patescibacteria group bacterium]